MKNIYPLRLKPYTKSVIWGSDLLIEKYNKETESYNIGESWELSCREKEKSTIINGEYADKSLNDYLSEQGYGVIGKDYNSDRFPLLIKLLSSSTPLSVQVHPDDEYSLKHEGELGKTEMWYIIECENDSELVIGLNEYNKEALLSAAKSGKLEKYLRKTTIAPGDSFYIPSGLVHAIGTGILLYEVQQNSDVTYRVYDYDRKDKDGNKRELHTEKAVNVIKEYTDCEINTLAHSKNISCKVCDNAETLISSDKFTVEKIILKSSDELVCTDESFLSLTVSKGEMKIEYNSELYPAMIGETYFIPAGLGKFKIHGKAEILCASIK
jgi:mannose-6-phosphate isomerase